MEIRRRCVRAVVAVTMVLACVACASDETSSSPSPPVDGAGLAVTVEGLVVVSPDGSTSTTPFGTTEGDAVAEVESVVGSPLEKGRASACAPTAQFVTFPGITIALLDGIFVGWTLRADPTGTIETVDGIGPGSTLAQLEAAYGPVTVDAAAELGAEFAAGDQVFGTLDGTGADARVASLWAGDVCLRS